MQYLTKRKFVLLALSIFLGCLGSRSIHARQLEGDTVAYFERHVRPLLIEHCYECHSLDTESSGGLSLDSREGLRRGGDSGAAIQLNEPDRSLLVRAIEYRDPKLQMPPSGKLSDAEILAIRTWIEQGATDPRESSNSTIRESNNTALSVDRALEHWAYRPLAPNSPPNVPFASHPIDAFLAVKQMEAGLKPSPLADLRIVKKRLDADLSGLPSQSDSSDSIVSSGSALERDILLNRHVDELLSSPRFGERFARHWMDLFRYAESLTLRGFILQDAWRYREYLIQAYNEDRPIDQFITEQIAGDLLTADSLEQRQQQCIATTALTLGDHNYEEQDKLQLEMDYIDEQIDTIGKALMAQTISCARCHDHKFDPIPTRDYYAIAGILKSSTVLQHENVSKWVRVPLPLSEEQTKQFASASSQLSKLLEEMKALKETLGNKPDQPLLVRSSDFSGVIVDNLSATQVGIWQNSNSNKAYVDEGYVHDKNSDKGKSSITFEPKSLPAGDYIVRMAYSHGDNRSSKTMVRIFSADGEKEVLVNQRKPASDDGLWHTLGTHRFESSGQAYVVISNEGSDGHVIADAVQFVPAGVSFRKVDSGIALSEQSLLEQEQAKKRSAELESQMKGLQQLVESRPMVQGLLPSNSPSDIPIHIRGSVHRLGDTVPRGVLTCVNAYSTDLTDVAAIPHESNGRLELAKWITHSKNPLTARVYVNRVWCWLMGRGIVPTLDNFGTTGELPTHPELLDWLTAEFIRHDWSTKWLVREIVTSDAYQRVCSSSREMAELDPENRLVGKANLRRLDAESLRDRMLVFSGELDLPSQLQATWKEGLKEDYRYESMHRYRTVYQPWFRNALPELSTEFDSANASSTISQRNRSTVATQALAIMNGVWVERRAKAAATRIQIECQAARLGGEIEQRSMSEIGHAFQLAFGRPPSDEEKEWAKSVVTDFGLAELVHQLMASIEFRFIE